MKLTLLLGGEFDTRTRNRGLDYYLNGRVRILSGSEIHVEAEIRSSDREAVFLSYQDGTLTCTCGSCRTGPCPHVWAAILAAENRRFLAAVESTRDLQTVFDGQEPSPAPPPPPKPPVWTQRMAEISEQIGRGSRSYSWPTGCQLLYAVNVASSQESGCMVVDLEVRTPKRGGNWGRRRELRLAREHIDLLPDPADREILALLAGARQYYAWGAYGNPYESLAARHQVPPSLAATLMPLIARTGRCWLRPSRDSEVLLPIAWDEAGPWEFHLKFERATPDTWALSGEFRRGEERMELRAPALVTAGGLLFTRERVAPLAGTGHFQWIAHLRKNGRIEAPEAETDGLLAALLENPEAPPVELPEELRLAEVRIAPHPCLKVRAEQSWHRDSLLAEVTFDYGGRLVPELPRTKGFLERTTRQFLARDLHAEAAATGLLLGLGLRFEIPPYGQPEWRLPPKKLPSVVRALVEAGWHVEAEGKIFRRPGAFRIEVATGIDWFELHGAVEYGGTSARLPELLAALRKGENMVRLGDGTYGMLPEEWLRRLGPLAGLGTTEHDHVRYRRNQAGLLDALLAIEPNVSCDEAFERIRRQLRRFDGVRAAEQPAGFSGELRLYQREGLGWMHFLRQFGFGGCLADDMGVGKTAQVLALLEARRELREAGRTDENGTRSGPSLVVVPKSLVFNWKQEAAKFAPRLAVLDYTGMGRTSHSFDGYDIVLTTYGTVRRDAALLKHIEFDYIVLDEAQAIKNAGTDSAKAVRLLHGDHRLALSGTPVENHLGELWSLFEFLNPGMLGTASVFKTAGGSLRNPGEETCRLLASALRPFILRRTKQQVARELPPKTEQTIHCEMEPTQRRLYDELRTHFRNTLLKRVEEEGLAKSKIHVLEALLRLRQAACHPGLIDPARAGEPSAKLDVLMHRLCDLIEEGHKALVFSQFTSLLKIVRDRLDGAGVVYEYLDGATHDRQARVERFQQDAACPLFLISLKAGGLGLNLTAAGYVFLLDPWWNPAVEAQAVDRAHRIGQTQQIFAYRLITRDTVEEKVVELQNAKRDLAAAIISEDNSLIRDLKREDLELLLS